VASRAVPWRVTVIKNEPVDLDALEQFIRGHPIDAGEAPAVARNVAVLAAELRVARRVVEAAHYVALIRFQNGELSVAGKQFYAALADYDRLSKEQHIGD